MAEIDAVTLANVSRSFGDVKALDKLSLSIRQGEFFSLLGPSGCGKTTLLRLIAGLETCQQGTVKIGDVDATAWPAHLRPVNTVFQSYALFPHLKVWDNVCFGLRMKKMAETEIARRVKSVLELVEAEPCAQRMPHQLSGGQKQRVALARALVNEPKVLLLDEPLAALDLKLRTQLQTELRNIQRRLGITFVYVTHDQQEALMLSDRIAVMRDGRIEQLGDVRELYEHPQTRFVSQFLGSSNLIAARSVAVKTAGIYADTELGPLRLSAAIETQDACTLAIRPERVHLSSEVSAGNENEAQVEIIQRTFAGPEIQYEVSAGALNLRIQLVNGGDRARHFQIGEKAWMYLPPEALVILHD